MRHSNTRSSAKLLLSFVAGALLTLGVLRYIPTLGNAVLGESTRTRSQGIASQSSGALQTVPASRLSYELSRPPAAEPSVGTERIVNVRPINPAPPEPGDRTREIQKEAQNPAYRAPPRSATAPVGKVFEGRDIPLKPKPDAVPPAREQASPPKVADPAAGFARLPAAAPTGSPPKSERPAGTDRERAAGAPGKSMEISSPGAKRVPAEP